MMKRCAKPQQRQRRLAAAAAAGAGFAACGTSSSTSGHHGCVWAVHPVEGLRFRSSYAPPRRQMHKPAGARNEKFVWQTHTADDTQRYDIDVREAHALLGTEPNDTLMRIKLNYLLRCRMFHPDTGGNAAMFYKITLAYERILHDRGVESRHGRISYSDVLGPRPKFDPTPLIPEEGDQSAKGTELLPDGTAVPWAKLAKAWAPVDDTGKEHPADASSLTVGAGSGEGGAAEGEVEAPPSAWEKDAMRSKIEHQAVAYGTETAGTYLRRVESENQDAAELAEKHAQLAAKAKAAADAAPLSDATDVTIAPTGTNAVTRTDDVTEVDAASHPDDGIVTIKKPKTALFNQLPLSKWSDEQLIRRWSTASDRLTHDEEEATAREIIERNINESGGQLTPEQKDFMMDHLVHRSDSVAGEAARSATDVMYHTQERVQIMREGAVLVQCIIVIATGLSVVYINYSHHLKQKAEKPELQEHLNADTMLPWWGNDVEYERTVKRLFVEEYRRARQAARRVQTFQDGVARESLPTPARQGLETNIFDVTSERLRELRARAERKKDGNVVVSQNLLED